MESADGAADRVSGRIVNSQIKLVNKLEAIFLMDVLKCVEPVFACHPKSGQETTGKVLADKNDLGFRLSSIRPVLWLR